MAGPCLRWEVFDVGDATGLRQALSERVAFHADGELNETVPAVKTGLVLSNALGSAVAERRLGFIEDSHVMRFHFFARLHLLHLTGGLEPAVKGHPDAAATGWPLDSGLDGAPACTLIPETAGKGSWRHVSRKRSGLSQNRCRRSDCRGPTI